MSLNNNLLCFFSSLESSPVFIKCLIYEEKSFKAASSYLLGIIN